MYDGKGWSIENRKGGINVHDGRGHGVYKLERGE